MKTQEIIQTVLFFAVMTIVLIALQLAGANFK